MGLTYRLDFAGFNEHLLNADFMVEHMAARAERGKAFAEAIAPVDPEGQHPGRYKESFSVESGKRGGVHHDRAYAIVSNDAKTDDGEPLAVFVEFGTEHSDGHHVLSKTLDALGGDL